MITILDYGAGNLRSVQNTLAEIGAEYELVKDAAGLQRATKIILPGVGHFGQMMRAFDAMQVREALLDRIRAGVPFLGICLGLQALFQLSEEAPDERGLGLFEGAIRRFSERRARAPHGLESGYSTRELEAVRSHESLSLFRSQLLCTARSRDRGDMQLHAGLYGGIGIRKCIRRAVSS